MVADLFLATFSQDFSYQLFFTMSLFSCYAPESSARNEEPCRRQIYLHLNELEICVSESSRKSVRL